MPCEKEIKTLQQILQTCYCFHKVLGLRLAYFNKKRGICADDSGNRQPVTIVTEDKVKNLAITYWSTAALIVTKNSIITDQLRRNYLRSSAKTNLSVKLTVDNQRRLKNCKDFLELVMRLCIKIVIITMKNGEQPLKNYEMKMAASMIVAISSFFWKIKEFC